MATTRPTTDSIDAFAAEPRRVNIFAKPDQPDTDPQPPDGNIFEAGAARTVKQPSDAELVAARPRGAGGPRSRARLGLVAAALAATTLAGATTIAALQPHTKDAVTPSNPASRPQPRGTNEARSSVAAPRQQRADGARARTRPLKRAKPHRPSRPRRTRRDQPPIARPAAPRSARPAAPLPVPRPIAPPRSHPAPVAPTAPPEFL